MTLTTRSSFNWITSLTIYFLCLFSMLFSTTMGSSAANSKNEYFVGGGVGSLKCIEFLSAMNKFRQKGGNTSVAGVMEIDAFGSYVYGFQTGFNMESPGVYDILAPLNGDMNATMDWLESWCQKNPTKRFGMGVVRLAETLRDDAKAMNDKAH